MNDLISRSALIDALKIHFDSRFREDGELLYSDHICTSEDVVDLIKLVENQPTVYDIDKVVAELEKLDIVGVEYCPSGYDDYICKYDVIEIVKAGGKNGEINI